MSGWAAKPAVPAKAEVAVIGGGVIGLSIAFHLAEAGVRTVLLERDELGSGASRATADVVRAYFAADPVSSELAVRSLTAYRAFPDRPGADPRLRQVGYLVLFTDLEQVAAFESDLPAQQAAGVDVELISAEEARKRNPLIGDPSVLAAAWAPHAYVCDTSAIVTGYAAAARRAGAVLCEDSPVMSVDAGAGLVETAVGTITAETIVCAAGAWSGPIARSAGVDLPLTEPVTQVLLRTDELPSPVPEIPVTLHAASGLLVRVRDGRLLIGMGYPGPDRSAWLDRLSAQLATTYPALAGTGLHVAVTGLRDASPDKTAFIGGSRSFMYAAGFSGHGLCNAPAAGEIIRDLVLGKDPGLDLTTLASTPERQRRI